ncbi:MAG TPA: hypothetical protein VI584_00965 [Nitrospiria bacterium]|nr:hypothetical protein [Nitrospiria bacterium]
MINSLFKIFIILISLISPILVSAACFDDLDPAENDRVRPYIDEAIKHSVELIEGGKRTTALYQEASKAKGLPDLRKKITEIEIHTRMILEHAKETINALNGALGAPDITKEAKGHGEEALARINEAITNLRQTLNSTKAAASSPDYSKTMEQTMEGTRYAERARSLAEEGYVSIKKM